MTDILEVNLICIWNHGMGVHRDSSVDKLRAPSSGTTFLFSFFFFRPRTSGVPGL